MRVVFICSAGHSGSTLLDLLLGAHPAAVSLGEITQLPKNLALNTACMCGSKAAECEFWTPILRRVRQVPEFREIESNPYALHLGMIKATNVVDRKHQTRLRVLYRKLVCGAAYAHFRWGIGSLRALIDPITSGARNKLVLFDIISRITNRDIVVDSSKHYLEAVSLYESAPSDVRIVLLVRDGRAVYYSGLKRGNSRRAALQAWKRTYRRAVPILQRHVAPEHLLALKYENLVTDPERELRRLCDFIGTSFDPEMLQFRDKTQHILNGNNMRFARESGIRADLAWNDRLSHRDSRYFDARGGELNREFGYS